MNQKMNVEIGIITLNSNNVSEIDHKSTISDSESSGNNILNEFSQIQVQDLQNLVTDQDGESVLLPIFSTKYFKNPGHYILNKHREDSGR